MDVAYHDEDLNREHKDVLDNIRVDSPLKVHMDTAWVYAHVAADEYRSGDLGSARQAQKWAEQAYRDGMMLLAENSAAISEKRLQEIISRLQQNRLLFPIDQS